MKKLLFFLVCIPCSGFSQVPTSDLLITEITDPENSLTSGRYVEIYNISPLAIDLSTGYALVRWTNAGTTPQTPKYLNGIIPANGFYVVCNSATKFLATYGVSASQDIGSGGPADSNGDDNIALLAPDGSIIDMFGVVGEDGSGTGHEFEDGRAERACGITSSSTWLVGDWNIDNDSGGGDGPQYAPADFDPFTWVCIVATVSGCMDTLSCNYDAAATSDDGTCDYDAIWQTTEIICNGDSLVVGSSAYYLSGTYIDSLSTIYGCDSTVYTTITVNNATDFQQSITICEGDSLVVGSNIYYNMGNYSDTLTTISGCDSIIFSDLDFFQPTPLIIQSEPNPPEICLGDTILLEASPGFVSYAWTNGMTGQIIYDNPTTDTWYMVEAVDANGCVVEEDINVYVESCITGVNETYESNKELLKITDILGRESKLTPNVSLFYRYNDGTVEKRIIVE